MAFTLPGAVGLYAGGKALNNKASEPGGKKSGGPPPADYMGLAREVGAQQRGLLNEQTQANRPNQSTPFASSQWTRGPNGEWQQNVSLNGQLGQSAIAAQNQLAEQMRQPLDFSTLQELGTGESARQQASDAAYRQASSRLDPQFQEMEDRNRTRLLNQGLAEGSEAYNKAMDRLATQRTDAYNQANFSAIREGTAAGQTLFGQNLAARQQGIQELLRARSQPMQDLGFLQSLTPMPGFQGAGLGQADNLLGAAGMADAAAFRRWQAQQQAMADLYGGLTDLAGTGASLAMFASDERVKTSLERHDEEVLPGVPLATFRYREGYGPEGLHAGVVAQDLQKVQPEAVHEGRDGILYVGEDFAPVKIGE